MDSPVASTSIPGVSVPLAVGEKPLGRSARFSLALSAFLAIGGFYLFTVVSILLLTVLLGGEVLVFALVVRFGVASFLVPVLRRHADLLQVFIGSFWIRSRSECCLPIREADAPRLFVALRRISAHFGVPEPRDVSLEMNAGAWVKLKGFRRRSATILGLGYDLVVGLSEAEVEAVLAHEMAHAQRVHRGMKFWLVGGINRAVAVSSALTQRVKVYRRKRARFHIGEIFLRGSDACTRLIVRLFATYSRQDEFDADAGAAAICGSAPLRSSLLKLDAIHAKASRIGWNERVAQLQKGGFGTWLRDELTVAPAADAPAAAMLDRYSTHPSISDRIAALPPSAEAAPSPPAIEFFSHPDQLARGLVTEMQHGQALAEQKDDAELRRWLRQVGRARQISYPLPQWLAILMVVFGAIFTCFAWADSFSVVPLAIGGGMIVAGVEWFRRLERRNQFVLAIPSYETLVAERHAPPKEREKELEDQFNRSTEGLSRRKKASLLSTEAYAALESCDYYRAHFASRRALELKDARAASHLALGIASAAFGQGTQASAHLRLVLQRQGIKSASTQWGVAWLLWLLGDWSGAEALLTAALKKSPGNPTFHALLSFCQGRRGKFQLAIANARRAWAADPNSRARIQLLVAWLIETGEIDESERILMQNPNQLRQIPELTVLMIRAQLLHGNFAEADCWIEILRDHGLVGQRNVDVGLACEGARRDEQAMSFYTAAAKEGYCPAALLGLARIHARRGERGHARGQIFASLNTSTPVIANAATPFQLLPHAIRQLVDLAEPAECSAWQALFHHNPALGPLSGQTFLVYAPTSADAVHYLTEVLVALNPNEPPTLKQHVVWKKAPADMQPIGPVHPGVQGI